MSKKHKKEKADPRFALFQDCPADFVESIKAMATVEHLIDEKCEKCQFNVISSRVMQGFSFTQMLHCVLAELRRRMSQINFPTHEYTKEDMFTHGRRERIEALTSHARDLEEIIEKLLQPPA